MRRFRFALAGLLILSLALGTYHFLNYYQVTSVEVRGSVHYDEEEIRSMVLKGFASQNTFLATRLLSLEDIQDHPYLDSIRVTALNRNSLSINVVEKKPIGCISYLGNYVYFDRDAVFVEGQTQREKGIPFFSSVKVSRVIKNERLEMQDRALILQAASVLYSFYEKTGQETDKVWIDENYQLFCQIGDITIRLGSLDLLEEKLSRAMAILPKLEGRYGLLHAETVTQNNKSLSFEELERPKKEAAAGQESEGDGSEKDGAVKNGSQEKNPDEKDPNEANDSSQSGSSETEKNREEESPSGEEEQLEGASEASDDSDESSDALHETDQGTEDESWNGEEEDSEESYSEESYSEENSYWEEDYSGDGDSSWEEDYSGDEESW